MSNLSSRKYLFFKAVMDKIFALIAIIVLGPVLILTAIAVSLSSRGPVLFAQRRVGKHGREFMFYKFRSMVSDAERLKSRLGHLDETQGPIFKIKQDPRITRIGKFIRKYSIDELPQLYNILRGDMSIIGPRPPLPEEVKQYTHHQLHRLSVTPGLSCLWQISGRSEVSFYEWIELDIYYIEHRSFLLDLKILIRTIPVVVSGKGSY